VPSVRDVSNDIEADRVSKGEGSHGVTSTELHAKIDIFERGITTLDEAEGFIHVRDQQAVDDEALSVLAEDGDLTDALGVVVEVVDNLLGGGGTLDDFNELHHGNGAEEVETGEVGLAVGDDGGLVVDGEGGGIGSEDGFLGSGVVDRGPELLLGGEIFEDSFDDEVRLADGFLGVGGGGDAGHDFIDSLGDVVDVATLLFDLLLHDAAEGLGDDVLVLGENVFLEVDELDIDTSGGGDLSDTTSHSTGTEDGDGVDGKSRLATTEHTV